MSDNLTILHRPTVKPAAGIGAAEDPEQVPGGNEIMKTTEMLAVLAEVACAEYHFKIENKGESHYLVAEYHEADVYSGEPGIKRTRKWLLSEHMTRSELGQTALKCVVTSHEHRVRESFLYRGRRVFGPHCDVESLWEIAEQTDVRKKL